MPERVPVVPRLGDMGRNWLSLSCRVPQVSIFRPGMARTLTRRASRHPLDWVASQFKIMVLDLGAIGGRLAYMCFKITPSLREYFNYRGISAELERRGYGSSRPELAWAIRQKQHRPEEPVVDRNKGVISSSPSAPHSN